MNCIDKHQRAGVMCQFRYLRNGIDGSDGVRSVANSDEFCFWGDFSSEIVEIERAVGFADIDLPDDDTLFFESTPRRDIGIMIQRGYDDFISDRQLTADRTGQGERDGGHVLAEDDFIRVAVKKISHGGAGGRNSRVIGTAGGKRTAGIGVRGEKIILHRVNDLLGNLSARGPVEKRSGLSVYLQFQRWKLRADPRGVERLTGCFLQSGCAHFCLAM